jgi:peptidoglycan hydrolase CwlO-like protein
MQSLTTRLTDIQEQVEKLIAFSTEQLQMHAMEIEQLQGEVEKLQASIHLLDQKIRDLAK